MNLVCEGSNSFLPQGNRRVITEVQEIIPWSTISRGQNTPITSQMTWEVTPIESLYFILWLRIIFLHRSCERKEYLVTVMHQTF
jgi:hypothetical protein